MTSMLDKLRAQKEKKSSGNSDKYLKLQEGETKVRFLPPKNPENTFIKEFGEHWINGTRIVCPKHTNGGRCPICETVNDLYNAKDDQSTEIAREYKAKKQRYANVIERGNEEAGPKILKFGVKLGDRIVDDCLDEGVDFSDPKDGHDYRVIKKVVAGQYPSYDSSRPERKASALDSDDFSKWMEDAIDIHEFVDNDVKSYNEIKAIFEGLIDKSYNESRDVTSDIETEEYSEDEFLKKVEDAVDD